MEVMWFLRSPNEVEKVQQLTGSLRDIRLCRHLSSSATDVVALGTEG